MLDLPLPSADDIGLPPAIGPLLSHYLPDLVRFRRDIHKHPELSYEEYRTTDRIVHALEAAGLHPVRFERTGCYVDVGRGPVTVSYTHLTLPTILLV